MSRGFFVALGTYNNTDTDDFPQGDHRQLEWRQCFLEYDAALSKALHAGATVAALPRRLENVWKDFTIHWDEMTGLDLIVDGTTIAENYALAGFVPVTGDSVGFTARTGRATHNVFIDDLTIVRFPTQPILTSGPIISEFMANNDNGLEDEDFTTPATGSNFITGPTHPVDLVSWYPDQCRQPADVVGRRGPAIDALRIPDAVRLRQRSRSNPAAALHTNFTLPAAGQLCRPGQPDGTLHRLRVHVRRPGGRHFVWIAQARPDRATLRCRRRATKTPGLEGRYGGPPSEDVSFSRESRLIARDLTDMTAESPTAVIRYTTDNSVPNETSTVYAGPIEVAGPAATGGPTLVLSPTAPVKAFIPTGDIGLTWTQQGFDDSAWLSGTSGVGYDDSPDYDPFTGLDVSQMKGGNQSIYIRQAFDVPDMQVLGESGRIVLGLRFDDAFVAYLNGTEIARSAGVPDPLVWDSGASAQNGDAAAVTFTDFDITAHKALFQATGNVLAIHGLNAGSTSSDLLFQPQITLGSVADGPTVIRARVYDADNLPGPVSSRTFLPVAPDLPGLRPDLPILVLDSYGVNIDATTGFPRPYRPTYAVMIAPDELTGRAEISSMPTSPTGRKCPRPW
ncbi:MAG: chitobiase/beta-hexosaminidase C-terminal domain-containing protein [Verrucomicrobiales bacterium]